MNFLNGLIDRLVVLEESGVPVLLYIDMFIGLMIFIIVLALIKLVRQLRNERIAKQDEVFMYADELPTPEVKETSN